MATERMYSRSLQDVAQSIVRVVSRRLSQLRHKRRKERMQACTIGMSMDSDIKMRSRRRSWKGHVYINGAKT